MSDVNGLKEMLGKIIDQKKREMNTIAFFMQYLPKTMLYQVLLPIVEKIFQNLEIVS